MTDNLLDETLDDQVKVDESKNYLEELVGPGKKFATAEDMAKGKYISDGYVTILEKRLDAAREEMKTLRDQNIAGPKLQELIDKYDALEKQLATRQTTQQSNEDTKAAYDPKQVESLIDSRVHLIEQQKRENDNFKLVQDKLKERFGNNYQTLLKTQSNTLGLTDDEVNSMARRNPNLFMKTFDLNVPKNNDNFQTPPKSNMRSDNFAPRTNEKRTWSYYEELRKKDPQAWFDPKIAVQMDKDSQALGEKFYDA